MPSFRQSAVLALIGMSFACKSSSEPPTPVPTTINLSPATANLAAIGAFTSITASVLDQNGTAMTGQTINWVVGDASVATVGATGTTVTVTAVSNGSTTITATSGAATKQATVTVEQVAAQIVKISGDLQTGVVGDTLPQPLVVEIRDQRGNPVPGGTGGAVVNSLVQFEATSGGGSVVTPASVGADGRASSPWVLGGAKGDQQVTASTSTLTASATFSATATVGAADSLDMVSGDGQQGTVDQPLTDSIVTRVVDQFGNGVSGMMVTFAANDAGASVSPTSAMSDTAGRAAAAWTLGSAEGGQTLTVTATGLNGSPRTVNATGVAAVTTSLVKFEGDDQIGLVGLAVNVPPAVKVEDQFGNGIAGVDVTFAITGGNGSLGGSTTKTTDADGVARVDSWTLDASAGVNALQVSSTGLTTVTFTATGQTAAFTIVVRYFGPQVPTSAQQAAFTAAANLWTSVVFGDLDNVSVTGLDVRVCQDPSDATLPSALTETIDDIVIYAKVDSIDGPGNILGQAGPCYIRTGGNQPGLPLIGTMAFDSADLNNLQANGQLGLVITHEMGHVLGFGSFWNLALNGTTYFSLLSGAGTSDPYFTGASGRWAFDAVGGTAYVAGQKVPVENTGGAGTRDAHWREAVFDRELMTGFLDNGPQAQPLSIVTLGSLLDMNYLVAYANAQAFAWPSPPALRLAGTKIEMVDDVYEGPVFGVDPGGRVVGMIRR